MLYQISYRMCGETIKDIVIEGPKIDNLEKILDEYENQWVEYVDSLRDEEQDNECEVEEKCLKKIKESFPIGEYIKFEDYEDLHAFAINMLLERHFFKKPKCKMIRMRW